MSVSYKPMRIRGRVSSPNAAGTGFQHYGGATCVVLGVWFSALPISADADGLFHSITTAPCSRRPSPRQESQLETLA